VGNSPASSADSDADSEADFNDFLTDARRRLVRALLPARGVHGAQDAASEGIAWALDNRDRLLAMDNPVGYLYRVALRRSIPRKAPRLPLPDAVTLPDIEPQLVPALMRLPERQRAAVWLVHACGWSYEDVAEGLGIGRSTVGTHVTRALDSLRRSLTGSDSVP